MQDQNDFFYSTSNKLRFRSNDSLSSAWDEVDLKVLLSILALSEPAITQAQVAQMLEISPITLSRVVNSEDRRVRKAWIPILTECLSSADLVKVRTTADALMKIKEVAAQQKALAEIIPVLESYISKRGLGYKIDSEYWGIADGLIRFYDSEKDSQWLISLGTSTDEEKWRAVRNGLGPFARFRRMQSITPDDKLSILYPHAQWFSRSIFGSKRYEDSSMQFRFPHRIALPCQRSLLLYSQESNQIEEEYVLSSDADPYNHDYDYKY